ncbi:response regulator, partial [candidate division CSSED10-310 bacterium]
LLVEDNSINQQVATEILQNVGIIVEIADNGEQAVRKVDQIPYDAVLMDIQMPVMDGYEATRLIRKKARHSTLPIIAMTAHAMKGDREKCFAAGMDDYVTKPIAANHLLSALAKWISQPEIEEAIIDPARKTEDRSPDIHLPDSRGGIDIKSGLKRIGGNRKLYAQLLRGFLRDYANIADEIKATLEQGNRAKAEQLVHTIKGVAGNISADELHSAAQELEKIIKLGKAADFNPIFKHFQNTLHKLIEELTLFAQQEEETKLKAQSSRSVKQRSTTNLVSLFTEFDSLLRKNNPKALDHFAVLKKYLNVADNAHDTEELENCINSFNFKGAREILIQIAANHDVSLAKEEK